jgi:hypothetical protein
VAFWVIVARRFRLVSRLVASAVLVASFRWLALARLGGVLVCWRARLIGSGTAFGFRWLILSGSGQSWLRGAAGGGSGVPTAG